MTCDEVKPLLNAHMDDEINPLRRTAVKSHIETCSSCATEFEQLESLRNAIRAEMPYYRASPKLRNQVRVALRSTEYLDRDTLRPNWRVWGAIAAGAAFCALATAPFIINDRNQSQLLAKEFLSAHERALIGKELDVISSDHHTVKPWFNGKLPFSPPVTDLRSEGFPLEGGRVDYAGDRPLAALVYSRRLHRIDVFVAPTGGQKAPPTHFEQNGYNEISWKKGDFLFTAVSDLNTAELASFVRLLQTQ
jgi:anti-sigma factor RsiW